MQFGIQEGYRGHPDNVSLKIKQLFHMLSSSSFFTSFCTTATKSQFTTKKTHGSHFTGNDLWQITAHDSLANHFSQERKLPFHVSHEISITLHGS